MSATTGRGRPERRDPSLDGIQVELLQRGLDGKLEQRAAGTDQFAHRAFAVAEAQVAGVRPAGLHRNIGLGDKALVFFEGPQRGLLASLITVEGEDDFAAGSHHRKGGAWRS